MIASIQSRKTRLMGLKASVSSDMQRRAKECNQIDI